MKLCIEIDLERGCGAFRWEGITLRRLRSLTVGAGSIVVGGIAILLKWFFHFWG